MNKIEFFTNDRYLVLKILYEHQIEINNAEICPITQQEIADALGCSKAIIRVFFSPSLLNDRCNILFLCVFFIFLLFREEKSRLSSVV